MSHYLNKHPVYYNYIQYRYRLYSGEGREDRNDDVIREVAWGEVESREGGVEAGEEVSFLDDV